MSGKAPQGGPAGSPAKGVDSSQRGTTTPSRTTSTAMSRHGSSDRQSLSTTPTQSQVLGGGNPMRSTLSVSSQAGGAGTGTLKAPNINTTLAPIAAGSASAEGSPSVEKPKSAPATQHRAEFGSSYTDDAQQAGTIGRGVPPRSAGLPMRGGVPARSGPGSVSTRDGSQSQRSLSGAPSDFETVSGMSASEFDSGDEDDAGQISRNMDSLNAPNDSIATRPGRSATVGSSTSAAGRAATTGSQSTTREGQRRSSQVRGGKESKKSRKAAPIEDEDKYGPLDHDDDEVQPRDLGEELVKRRMKARQKEQKEKARRKKLEEAERRRQSQSARPPSTIPPSSPRLEPRSAEIGGPSSPGVPDREGRPIHIAIPPLPSRQDQLLLSPGSQVSPGITRSASAAQPSGQMQQQQQQGANVYPSPHGHIRRPLSSYHLNSPAAARRNSSMSGVSSAHQPSQAGTVIAGPRSQTMSVGPSETTGDVFSDDGRTLSEIRGAHFAIGRDSEYNAGEDEGDYFDERRDALGRLVDVRAAADSVRQSTLQGEAQEEAQEAEEGEEGEEHEAEEESPHSASGDELSPDDVEYTLKDRQDAINIEHPFGLPIWKPALYKKSRSVTRNAETALHSMPSAAAQRHLLPGNILWTILFGSWLSAMCFIGAAILYVVPNGGKKYSRVAFELGGYIFWPFGKYVEQEVSPSSGQRNSAALEDGLTSPGGGKLENPFTAAQASPEEQQAESSGSGSQEDRQTTPRGSDSHTADTSLTQVHANDPESAPLNGKGKAVDYGALNQSGVPRDDKARIAQETDIYSYVFDEFGNEIGADQRYLGRLAYGTVFWLFLAPLMGIVCLLCWVFVFTIPMAKLTWVLLKNLSARPLALHFRSAPLEQGNGYGKDDDEEETAKGVARPLLRPGQLAPRSKSFSGTDSPHRRSTILLCTYQALGMQYYKYTVGGVNIMFINTLPLIFVTIADFFFLEPYVEHHKIGGFLGFFASQGIIFMMALGSVIPLSYFIGMAVASISAQSSIGMGAVINATFGSIVEIILYGMALTQNKAKLVEGSIIGSILAGVLLMPGLSMCSGATRRKEQRFNARSAGVTSTMLIMAIIGILTPTLFYQIYGTFQLTCEGCPNDSVPGESWTCKRCFYEHVPPATDPFFQSNVKGLMYTCTVILVLSYGIGLWFSLRTHASQIWQNPTPAHQTPSTVFNPTSAAPEMGSIPSAQRGSIYKKFMPAANAVVQQLLPTAQRPQSQASQPGSAKDGNDRRFLAAERSSGPPPLHLPEHLSQREVADLVAASAMHAYHEQAKLTLPRSADGQARLSFVDAEEEDGGHGGHDAPNWSRRTSVSVLLACTVLYAVIAEVLVDVVDVVLDGSGIDEKFLGITLFALVPNTTEFMNAVSFAINGNIALSMEIGSAYALQVCLIQIPAMVLFSGYYNATHHFPGSVIHHTFTLIFPRWDVIAIIFSVFLLTYTYIEARSNYYRGSICILSYLVLVAGFFFAPVTGDLEMPPDTPNLLNFTSFSTLRGAFGAQAQASAAMQSTSFGGLQHAVAGPALEGVAWLYAIFASLWAR